MRRDRLAFLSGLLWCGFAAAAPPAVTSVTPSAVTPGKTVDVTLRGSGLDAPVSLWTSFPADARLADSANDHATYSLNVPAEVPVGVGALRVATKGGVSSLVPLFLDDLPTVDVRGKSHSFASAP